MTENNDTKEVQIAPKCVTSVISVTEAHIDDNAQKSWNGRLRERYLGYLAILNT